MLNNTADQLRNRLTSLVSVKVSWFCILSLQTITTAATMFLMLGLLLTNLIVSIEFTTPA
jgi:hypothetical protein